MNERPWPSAWIRAVLAQSTLAVIAAEGTTYGYQILQRLEAAGFGKIEGGTLYPILARLEAEGFVTSSWGEGDGGPGRKFISITDAGQKETAHLTNMWLDFTDMITALWGGNGEQ